MDAILGYQCGNGTEAFDVKDRLGAPKYHKMLIFPFETGGDCNGQ
jgi:hypothetical protein